MSKDDSSIPSSPPNTDINILSNIIIIINYYDYQYNWLINFNILPKGIINLIERSLIYTYIKIK